MPEQTNTVALPMEREVILTRIIDAPRELVFKAWTQPKHMAQWWGPHGFTNPVCELDVRPGGKYYIEMTMADGTQYPCSGVYTEIVAPELLSFTNLALDASGATLAEGFTTVTFADLAGKTEMKLVTKMTMVVPEASGMLTGMETGWSQSLARLAELMTTGKVEVREPGY